MGCEPKLSVEFGIDFYHPIHVTPVGSHISVESSAHDDGVTWITSLVPVIKGRSTILSEKPHMRGAQLLVPWLEKNPWNLPSRSQAPSKHD